MRLKVLLTVLFAILSFLCFRYVTTSTPPRDTYTPISIIARVNGMPEADGIEFKYPLKVTHQFTNIKNIQHVTNIRLRSKKEYRYGDILHINGLLTPYNNITASRASIITTDPNPFIKGIYHQRGIWEEKIYTYLPKDHATLALGMTIGTNRAFSAQVTQVLQETSTVHMVVVSGFNIAIVTGIVLGLAGHLPRKTTIIAALAANTVFVIFTGAQPPTVRAAIMASIALIGQLYGRLTTTVFSLFLSAGIFISVQPQIVHSLSFQLSVMATLGIIAGSYLVQSKHTLIRELTTTLGAQLTVVPLILTNFGSLSLIGPIANLLSAWTVPFIMLGTAITIGGTYLHESIGKLMSYSLIPFTAFFLHTNSILAKLPLAYIDNIKMPSFVVVVYYIVLCFIVIKTVRHKNYSNRDNYKKTEKGIIEVV